MDQRITWISTWILLVLAAATSCQAGKSPSDADSSDETGHDASPNVCRSDIGFIAPLAVCSPTDPCTRPLGEDDVLGEPDDDAEPITEPTTPPLCRTSDPKAIEQGRPVFDDGPPTTSTGIDGTTRHACRYVPPGASATSPRPLLVFVHGSGGNSDDLYNFTLLRAKAPSYDLSRDPQRPGFALLAIQARNLHWPTMNPEDGSKHDTFHRDLASPSDNPDIANLDDQIDALVQAGAIDPSRIYVTGWSNGARFAQLYAIARHTTATPGGNNVRAATIYSGADPFNTLTGYDAACALDPYPQSTVPIFVVGRDCDIIPCNAAHAEQLADELTIDPGDVMEQWVADLESKVGNPNVVRRIVSARGLPVTECAPLDECSSDRALLNHLRWPDGLVNNGFDNEPAMLDFLRLAD